MGFDCTGLLLFLYPISYCINNFSFTPIPIFPDGGAQLIDEMAFGETKGWLFRVPRVAWIVVDPCGVGGTSLTLHSTASCTEIIVHDWEDITLRAIPSSDVVDQLEMTRLLGYQKGDDLPTY